MVYFPLSTSSDIISLQDIMHIVVTALVVLLTVIALVLLVISFYILKLKKICFYFLFPVQIIIVSADLTNLVPPAYFGLLERFSVYTEVIYIGIISWFNFSYKNKIYLTK